MKNCKRLFFLINDSIFHRFNTCIIYFSRNVNTYVYLFSCPSKMPFLYPPWMGADHADDLQYVYGKPFLTPLVYTQEERDASDAMMTYWTNFAWTG